MLTSAELQGVYVPLVTPFLPNGEPDTNSFERCLETLLRHPIHGIVLNGTTGEAPTVAWDEVERLFTIARAALRRLGVTVPIVVGTGTNDTRTTALRTARAGEWGADAALVVTPYYSRPSEEGVLRHYREAADTGVPVIAYDVPERTGLRLSDDAVRRMIDLDGVIGLKDSTPGCDRIGAIGGPHAKPVMAGDDVSFCEALRRGAAGGILAAANLRTPDYLEVYRLSREGRLAEAEAVFVRLAPLIRLLFRESNPAPIKRLLHCEGIIASDALRLPMTPISPALHEELLACLNRHFAGKLV